MTYTFTRNEIADIANIFEKDFVCRHGFTNADTVVLWLRNSKLASLGANTIHVRLSRRWELMARIDECRRDDGKMWVSESGMDCDCVSYSGHLHECEANLRAYEKLGYEINEWADGPFNIYPITEEQAAESRPRSRDLAMEAYEDGHPHSVSEAPYDEDGAYDPGVSVGDFARDNKDSHDIRS